MMESVYEALAKIGYTHPLHPTMTHVVMGMVMGGFLFGLLAWLFKKPSLAQTARHCMVLALIALPPTAVLGYMDWQHSMTGAWLFPIKMKIPLAAVLLILLIIAVIVGLRTKTWSRNILLSYTFCLIIVVGIGYFGGELVYGKKAPVEEAEESPVNEGAIVFEQNCLACHHPDKTEAKFGPGLKGLFKRDTLPASGRPVTEANVRMQLQTPFKNMPSFAQLPEEKVAALIAYLNTL